MTKQIKFNDVSLRDGQQSIAATRMTTEQSMRVLGHIADAGYAALELWGGAILDSCVRFLGEDPWERLDAFYALTQGKTPIRALLRGQNLFAYQPYPDDLVIEFIKVAVQSGVGVMRVFDALNDWRNLQIPILSVRAFGAQAEAAMSYTTSPVHTSEYYVDFAVKLQREGADRIAIKDMAGILYPWDAIELFRGLKAAVQVPLVLHTHETAGVGTLDAVIAMREGMDEIDTAITPFAGGSSHPPIEVLIAFAEVMGIEHNLDVERILRAQEALFGVYGELRSLISYDDQYFRPVTPADVDRGMIEQILKLLDDGSRAALDQALVVTHHLLEELGYPPHDSRMFESQVPGGMLSNLQNQLIGMGQPDILPEVMAEIPVVRRDVGYVPLVTPTSQIVGSQAVFNIVTGQRYSFMSEEFRMLLRGEFGRTPIPPNQELLAQVLSGGDERKVYRPASYLMPILEDQVDLPFVRGERDLLLHHLLGASADQFLKQRDGIVE
ncbi:MAG: hypothetical protein JW750_05940 [Anaerolineaceae bacterium]|nr:hypothetical protein [Anaerolineaceae bacterium]